MSGLHLRTHGPEGTRRAAKALAGVLRAGDLLVLDGPLGAGKTTFTQGLGAGLGVRGPVASPTFVIARVHPSLTAGPALVHVDAYRLGENTDLDELDLDAEIDEAVTVVEWGRDRIEHMTESHLLIELERPQQITDLETPEEPRSLRFTLSGPRWDEKAVADLRCALTEAGLEPELSEREN